MDVITDSTLRFFHYYPNKPLAIVGLVVFALFVVYLPIRIYKSRSRVFLYILPITALMECIGYLMRYLCADGTTLGKYIIMTLFLLLPPNALALVNYKAAGEMVRLSNVTANTKFFLRPKFVTWFFFWSDVAAFWLQGGGGGLQAGSSVQMANIGRYITLVGLAVQLVFLASFGLIVIHVGRNPAYQYHVEGQVDPKKKMVRCLLVTLVLLYVRSIYRFAEYAAGYDGPIATSEWAFYVFDGLAIAIMFVLYSFWFIGDYLPNRVARKRELVLEKITSANSSEELNREEHGIQMNTPQTKYDRV